MKKSFFIVMNSKFLVWLLLFTTTYFIANKYYSEIISLPFLREIKHFSYGNLSLMALIGNPIQVLGAFFASNIERKLGNSFSLLGVVVLIPLMLLGVVLSNNFILTAFSGGIYFAATSFREAITEKYVNNQIQNRYRATILSINSMLIALVAIVIVPLLGKLTDIKGLNSSFLFVILLTTILGLLLLSFKKTVLK